MINMDIGKVCGERAPALIWGLGRDEDGDTDN